MGPRTDDDFREKLRALADIREIIGGYLPLKKAGNRFRGLCPFHSEKTPSFHVDPGKQLFYCFGCGTGGDVFRFLMLYEKVDFPEALRMLARRYGVPIPEFSRPVASEKQALLKVHRAAVEFFRGILKDSPDGKAGRDYVGRRGLSAETIESFGLGFSPGRWEALKAHLLRSGFPEAQLLSAGVLLRREESGRTYDRFRGRLIFPIRNLAGECVGFGGRLIGDGEPKYLNSPETVLFRKGEILYGLDRTGESLRKEDRAILVEGYMDFLSLHQAGIPGVVATLGTGFTAGHARLLSRFTRRVVVNFDPDPAGQSAARRSLEILLESGFQVRVLRLPGGKDPDRFVREDGAEAYRALVDSAPPYLEYLAREAAGKVDLNTPAGKIEALNLVLPYVARLESAVERSEQVKLLAERFRIEDGIVLQEVRAAVAARKTILKSVHPEGTTGAPLGPAARLIRALIEMPEARETLLPRIREEDLAGSDSVRLWQALRDGAQNGAVEISYPRLGSLLSEAEDQALLMRMAATEAPAPTLVEAEDCLRRLRETRLARRMQDLQERLERAASGVEVDDLMRRKMELRREIRALKSSPAL